MSTPSLCLWAVGVACLCLSLVSPSAERVEARTPGGRAGGARTERQARRLYRVSESDQKTGERRFGFIDQTGRLVIGFDRLPKETVEVGNFQEGRALIQLRKKGVLESAAGYIDETGRVVIAPRFDAARAFSEGLAYAEAKGFRGYIDRRGEPVITLKVEDLADRHGGADLTIEDLAGKDFHGGLAAVGSRGRGGQWGYIDRSGRLVVRPQYSFADDFSEGLAGVETGGKFGFIDGTGGWVIPPRFRPRKGTERNATVATSRFREGLACVSEDELYGYVDKRGEFRIAPQFAEAQEFSEGLAQFIISAEGRYMRGYMDRGGKVVIGPRGAEELGILSPFVGGVALVIFYEKTASGTSEKYGYIDKRGRFIWRSK